MKNLFITSLILLCCSLTYSQDEKTTWIDAGAGVYASFKNETSGFSIGVDFNLEKNNNLLTFRYLYNIEFVLFTDPYNYLHEIGFLYGKIFKKGRFQASASAGVGFVMGTVRTTKLIPNTNPTSGIINTKHYESNSVFPLALPVEGNISYYLSEKLGLGVKAYLSINPDYPVMGLLGTIHLRL